MSASIPTFPIVEYPTPLEQVPPGCYLIEVVQYWRGEYTYGRPLPLHWATVVRTSAQRGNTYEIVGDMNTYTTQDRSNILLDERGDWRGGHVIRLVSPTRLHDFIALMRMVRDRWAWNYQNRAYDALNGIYHPGLYTDVNMAFGALQTQM